MALRPNAGVRPGVIRPSPGAGRPVIPPSPGGMGLPDIGPAFASSVGGAVPGMPNLPGGNRPVGFAGQSTPNPGIPPLPRPTMPPNGGVTNALPPMPGVGGRDRPVFAPPGGGGGFNPNAPPLPRPTMPPGMGVRPPVSFIPPSGVRPPGIGPGMGQPRQRLDRRGMMSRLLSGR